MNNNNYARERGHFCCNISDAAGNLQQLYVNIRKLESKDSLALGMN